MMDKGVFVDLCESLCVALGIKLPEKPVLREYYTEFSYADDVRFTEAVAYLKKNTVKTYGGGVRFPLISDFKVALSATAKPFDNYDAAPIPTEDERTEVVKLSGEFANKFRTKPKIIPLPKQADLYERMRLEGKVYSYDKEKWVHESLKENIGGEFIVPQKIVKTNDSGIKHWTE